MKRKFHDFLTMLTSTERNCGLKQDMNSHLREHRSEGLNTTGRVADRVQILLKSTVFLLTLAVLENHENFSLYKTYR